MNSTIKNELQAFQEFKRSHFFVQKEIKDVGGKLYCDDAPLHDEDGNLVGICDQWVNVGYKLKGPLSKALSNLFPYDFEFKKQHLKSIEAFFQGIKFPDKDVQKCVFCYSGIDAVNIQIASGYDWKKSGCVYWQGKAIKRDSTEYDDLVDELYTSAAQNPLYRQVLKDIDRYILHSIGKTSKEETVFTRYEFEAQLNGLSRFVKTRG